MGFQRTDDFRTRTQLYLDLQTIQLIVMLPFRPDQTSPPAVRMSLDRFIVSDDAARRRSQQMSSNSQSQEFRSQATTQVFSSLGSSLNESQNSSGLSRYEEIVASGRHLETKDSLEAIRQNVMGLTTMFTSIHKKVDENSEQMKQLLSAIKIINTRQDGHDTALQDIHDTLKALKEQLGAGNIHIPFDLHLAEDGDAGTGTECGGTISPISDDGISLKDYLSSKRQRTSVPTSPSFLQSAGHERADKSVSSHGMALIF